MEAGSTPEQLARAVAAGDVAAFEALVLGYQDRLFSFALRLCGNAEDAEEVVQDSFVKAYRALGDGRMRERLGDLALTPWLYQITLNTARNRFRRKRAVSVPLDEVESRPAAGALVRQGSADGDPEGQALRADRQAVVERALQELPVSCRAAVALRFVEGLSYEEIAVVLRQPLGTVKSHVYRGSRRLRRTLGAELGVDAS